MVTIPIHEAWAMVVLILLVVEVACFILIIALNVKLIVCVKRSYPSEFEWFIANNHIQYGLSFFLFNRLPAHDHILGDADVKRLRRKVVVSLVAFMVIFVALFIMLYLKRMRGMGPGLALWHLTGGNLHHQVAPDDTGTVKLNGTNSIPLAYDADGLLTGAGSLAITRSAQTGFVTGATLGGTSTAYTYNTFGELASERHTGAGAVLYDVAYTRDKLGRITSRIETVGGVATTYGYVYDAAGRLTQVVQNGAVTTAYAYDMNGNRLGKTDSIGTTAGTYDAQDRLLSYGANSYAYTANGELQSKTNAQGTTSYTYDVLGNLTAITMPDGMLIEYVIDGANRRVGKKVNGILVQGWLYSGQLTPIAELDGTGNVVSVFVYGTKANVLDYVVKNGTMYRIVSDHLGSPRLVVDTVAGTIAQQITYDEFGNIVTNTNPDFIPFGFGGGLYDKDTGLVRFGARDYDAESGRWTKKDPIRKKACFGIPAAG